jgi:hypothetical protein
MGLWVPAPPLAPPPATPIDTGSDIGARLGSDSYTCAGAGRRACKRAWVLELVQARGLGVWRTNVPERAPGAPRRGWRDAGTFL